MDTFDTVQIRELHAGEIEEAHGLLASVFEAFIAPHYSDAGNREFKAFITPSNLRRELAGSSFILIARVEGAMAGLIGIRDHDHVFLLFVREAYQRQGIARALLAEALARCVEVRPGLERVTVHASPHAVEAYKRLGFTATGEEQSVKRMRFVPMVLHLDHGGGDGSGRKRSP